MCGNCIVSTWRNLASNRTLGNCRPICSCNWIRPFRMMAVDWSLLISLWNKKPLRMASSSWRPSICWVGQRPNGFEWNRVDCALESKYWADFCSSVCCSSSGSCPNFLVRLLRWRTTCPVSCCNNSKVHRRLPIKIQIFLKTDFDLGIFCSRLRNRSDAVAVIHRCRWHCRRRRGPHWPFVGTGPTRRWRSCSIDAKRDWIP